MSRSDLIRAYLDALPFVPLAIVPIGGGGCRVETGAPGAPPGEAVAIFYFKASHLDLVLGAAGLGDGPIDQSPVAVAALIRGTAKGMGAPYQTAAGLRADAEREVDKILERVRASNSAGGLQQVNRSYKAYRQAQLAKAEKAVPYSKFVEPFVMTILRQIATAGRMVG
jgi:hypothetical protein